MLLPIAVRAEEPKKQQVHYPVAVLPFHERGGEVAGLGAQVSDLLVASLAKDEKLWLVDARILPNRWPSNNLISRGLSIRQRQWRSAI